MCPLEAEVRPLHYSCADFVTRCHCAPLSLHTYAPLQLWALRGVVACRLLSLAHTSASASFAYVYGGAPSLYIVCYSHFRYFLGEHSARTRRRHPGDAREKGWETALWGAFRKGHSREWFAEVEDVQRERDTNRDRENGNGGTRRVPSLWQVVKAFTVGG